MTPEEQTELDDFIQFLQSMGFTKAEIEQIIADEDSSTYKMLKQKHEDQPEEPIPNTEHPVEPDAEGNCPDGMTKGEDGMCRTIPEEPITDAAPGETPAEMLKHLVTKKHSLKHKFGWPVALMLEPGEEVEMMLFKGVAMQEGEMKRGEKMDKDNLLFATGAMSTAAMMGVALMDIDHFENAEDVPKEYLAKYGEDLIKPYPPAFIIDAAVEENVIEPNGRKVNQVEFIGACTNRLVYDMIKTGKFKGCSVVDYYRKEVCDDCNGTDGKCDCSIEGSHFLANTFILEEVPNSDGTWVEVLSEKDVGTIIERPTEAMVESLKLKSLKDPRMRMKSALLTQNKKLHSLYDLDKYMDESGLWLDGKASIIAFLVDEKNIPETTSQDMADYLFAHPDALNQYQYDNMSAEDLVAWFRHITELSIKAELTKLNINVNKLNILQHNADGLKELRNIIRLSQEDVNYGPTEPGAQCQECRWFMEGTCAIVEGEILPEDGCDRFEAKPPETPAEEAEHDPVEPDADGNCPDGMVLDEADNMCKIPEPAEEASHEPIAPDADGACPDGWELKDIDGTPMCVMPEGVPEKQENKLIKVAAVWKLYSKKPHATVTIERMPEVKQSIVRKQYLERREKILNEIKGIGIIIGLGVENMQKMGRLTKLRNQLKDLDHILKKT